jgi:hypothetical protein
MFVVRGRTPAQGVPREGEHNFHPSMLQLPVGGRGKAAPRQLSGLQAREGGTPEEEVSESTQNHNGKGVPFCPHHPRRLLRGGSPRQRILAAATTGDFPTRKRNKNFNGPCTAETNRSIRPGPTCKPSTSRQYVESSNCSSANYDRGQWCTVRRRKIVVITKIVLKLMNQDGH